MEVRERDIEVGREREHERWSEFEGKSERGKKK